METRGKREAKQSQFGSSMEENRETRGEKIQGHSSLSLKNSTKLKIRQSTKEKDLNVKLKFI